MNALESQIASARWRQHLAFYGRSTPYREIARYLSTKLDFLGRAYGGVLMIGSPRAGLILLGSLAIEPQHFVGAMVGLLVAEGCRKMIGVDDPAPLTSMRANAILTGVAASWLAAPAPYPEYVALLLIIFASAAAALISAALSRAMSASPAPPLSAAFVIVFAILLTLFPQWTPRAVLSEGLWPYPVGPTGWIDSALRSLGMIVFSPRPVSGLLVLLALLSWSRLAVLHGAVGWIVGILLSKLLAQLGFQWLWLVSAHNSFIAGMLLGAVFHLPGRSTLVASAIAGASASILALFMQTALSATAWAYQPLPALVTVWIGLFALAGRTVQHGLAANSRREIPPEQAWRLRSLSLKRFGPSQPLLAVPLAGPVTIAQGFDGSLSHRGAWRHALDFVGRATPEAGDPTIFHASVYCPASGVVEQLRDSVEDNPFGISNYAQNWGNYIILRMDQGGWLMLAHLAQGSIGVAMGQRAVVGQILARVGNSGRSPVPHLHMHVQQGPLPGDPTMAFRLANYLSESAIASVWTVSGVPETGTLVRAALPVAATLYVASSLAPGKGLWCLKTEGSLPAHYAHASGCAQLVTTLAADGSHIVADDSGGSLQLLADLDALRIYAVDIRASLLLRIWALGLPVLPYCAVPGVKWRDEIDAPGNSWKERIRVILAPYVNKQSAVMSMTCRENRNGNRTEIVVEADRDPPSNDEPLRIVSRIEAIKGPVAFEAQFESGRLVAELIAFEPGLPTG